jgi:hypothetical protein
VVSSGERWLIIARRRDGARRLALRCRGEQLRKRVDVGIGGECE